MIAGNTALPVNMDTLCASVSNKSKLQVFLRKGVIENENTCPEAETVFTCFCAQNMTFPCQSLREGCHASLSDLDLTIEEADVQLVPNTFHATQPLAKRLVILSGCTCHGSGTLLLYVLKMVILWKQRIYQ